METHHCQAKQPSVSSRPNKQCLFTTAQQGTCKNMLNIYLVQLFSNWVRGNNKGCLRAPRVGTHNIRVWSEKTTKTGISWNWTDREVSIINQRVWIWLLDLCATSTDHELLHLLNQTFHCPKISSDYKRQGRWCILGTFKLHVTLTMNFLCLQQHASCWAEVIHWGLPTQNPQFSVSTSPTDFI